MGGVLGIHGGGRTVCREAALVHLLRRGRVGAVGGVDGVAKFKKMWVGQGGGFDRSARVGACGGWWGGQVSVVG